MVAGLAGCLAVSLLRLEVTTDLTHFLSDSDEIELAQLSRAIASSALTRTMVLVVRAPELPVAVAAAKEWSAILAEHPEVERIQSGPEPDWGQIVFKLYYPRRYLLLSATPERELPVRYSDAGLVEVVRRLRMELALPSSDFTKRIAPGDPLLAFLAQLERMENVRPMTLEVSEGQFVDASSSAAVLLLTTRHSPFDSNAQGPLLSFVGEAFRELNTRAGGGLRLEQAGVHRFAVRSEQIGRQDASRFATISMVAIGVLFLVVFRSLRLLLASIVPLVGGITVATAAGLLVFGKLHIITLVFGSTLIGVCIDYPIHLITHHTMMSGEVRPWESFRRVRMGLFMGASTTVVGFVGFAWSSFPGIRELGFFAAIGVAAALLTTAVLVVPLLSDRPTPSRIQARLSPYLEGWRTRMLRPSKVVIGVLIGSLVVCAIGLWNVVWEHDVSQLNMSLPAEMLAEEGRIREELSQLELGRLVVVLGADEEIALARNDRVHALLTRAVTDGLIEDFRSLHSLIWSSELQRRNWAALTALPDLGPRVVERLIQEGFRASAFAAFEAVLRGDAPAPLRLSDLRASPLATLIDSFVVRLPSGSTAILNHLGGVRDPQALEALLAEVEETRFLDQRAFIGDLFWRYRQRAVGLILASLVGVLALLYVRYRSPRLALACLAPALLASLLALALISLFGTEINLLHLLGLLLVLCFGVDYSVFLIEARDDAPSTTAALLAVSIACLSTCLSFGLLSFSAFPALRSLGETTGLGVLLSLLLAPMALRLVAKSNPT